MNSGCFQIVIIIFNLLYIYLYIHNKLPLKRGRWGVSAENCHNCHNCHTLVVEMGSVVDDGFLASCCFRSENA